MNYEFYLAFGFSEPWVDVRVERWNGDECGQPCSLKRTASAAQWPRPGSCRRNHRTSLFPSGCSALEHLNPDGVEI